MSAHHLICMAFYLAFVHQQSARAETRTFGMFVSAGNPFPTLLGVNAGYNLDEHFRLVLGYGEYRTQPGLSLENRFLVEDSCRIKTAAAGAEFLFIDAPVRGAFGVKAAYIDISGHGDTGLMDVKKSTDYLYSNLGMDWINPYGFHFAGGLNFAFAGMHSAGFYVNSGYFF